MENKQTPPTAPQDETSNESSPASPPISSPALAQSVIKEPRSRNNTVLWVVAVSLLAVITLAVLAYYFLALSKPLLKPSDHSVATTKSDDEKKPVEITANSLVENLKPTLKGEQLEVTKVQSGSATTSDNFVVYVLAPYQVPGNAFKNTPVTGYGVGVEGDKATIEADYATAVTFLESKGLSKSNESKGKSGESNIISALYGSAKVLCYVSMDSYQKYLVSVGCADIASYEKAAKTVEPFFEAYRAENPKNADNLSLGEPNIKDGTDGYKSASLYMGHFAGLFYLKPGNDWKFFLGTQAIVPCDNFDTYDVKMAFAGQRCSDSTGELAEVAEPTM